MNNTVFQACAKSLASEKAARLAAMRGAHTKKPRSDSAV